MPIAALSCQPISQLLRTRASLLRAGIGGLAARVGKVLSVSLMSLQPPAHVSYMVLFGGTDCLVHTIVETDQLRVDGSR